MAEPDFSGWATKNDLRCSDGLTIRAGAFTHMDKQKVPLVWQHQRNDPSNILGHAILEDRAFGVYTQGFLNNTEKAKDVKEAIAHGDITAMSIYANRVSKRGNDVVHGDIKEVSLVVAPANPGALIEQIYIKHGDDYDPVDGEVVIYTGLNFEHSIADVTDDYSDKDESDEDQSEGAEMADDNQDKVEHADGDKTVSELYAEMSDEQKQIVHFFVGKALESINEEDAADVEQSDDNLDKDEILEHINKTIQEGFDEMTRNVFEQNGSTEGAGKATLSHTQIKEIVEDAQRRGSLKESFLEHAATYGIEDIDVLFPDAKLAANSPEIIARRTEWVQGVLSGTKHSPFARVKSTAADLTADAARAKGYVKGNLKKDEVIKLLKRVTTPTTIYKKQKLDRDDIVDITDLDVVSWLKAEMRLMLEEEIARAILIGDGRESDDEDKIDEDHIRPIAFDADMYSHKVTIQSNASGQDVINAILRSRTYYKGTGTPTLYTTDAVLTDLILLTDKVGRRLYETEASLAAALRVEKIVTVEVMNDVPEVLAILVNLSDYQVGADKGGNVSMFDDFDIDYNQYKYLIETRISGALTKPKSALVIRRDAGTIVTPTSPSFDGETNTITIPSVAGVVYKIDGATVSGQVVIDETTEVEAFAATGYAFPSNTTANWTFVYTTSGD